MLRERGEIKERDRRLRQADADASDTARRLRELCCVAVVEVVPVLARQATTPDAESWVASAICHLTATSADASDTARREREMCCGAVRTRRICQRDRRGRGAGLQGLPSSSTLRGCDARPPILGKDQEVVGTSLKGRSRYVTPDHFECDVWGGDV